MLTKRKIIFDDYDTAVNGLWTLAACYLSEAEPVTNLVEIPGRVDGPLDASTALTGDIQYQPRTLEVTLESSEGTRQDRKKKIDYMVNKLHGQRVKIWLPDDGLHYLLGRLSIKEEYNDHAHASITVLATCEPWRYDNDETVVDLTIPNSTTSFTLSNDRRPVSPVITVQGLLKLVIDGSTYTLNSGTFKHPDLLLKQGGQTIKVYGSGSATFTYRKAVL